ncbi:MAG TPA: PAS domain-containing protein [Anaerolineales bacterium]|nr:PAS domain-containing protein [Anaerolineales bacterium]
MSTNPGRVEESSGLSQPISHPPPSRFLAILALLIFLAEMVAMIILYFLNIPDYAAETLLDGIIMLSLILPGLYFIQLKPLIKEIEERDRAEGALRASESLLRRILESLPVGVWITDKNGQIIHGNPATRQIWGGARYVGIEQYGEYKGWWADTGVRIEPEQWAAARAISHGETSLNEEVEIESFDGAHKIILNSAVPIVDEKAAIQGAIVVNQDITRRRRAEKELIRTNELLERFFSSIDTLIAYMDRDFNFIRVNDTYARSGGHPPEFFIGRNHFDLYPHEENQVIFRRVAETGEPFSVLEKPFENPEFPERGVTYWDWNLQPVKETDGKVEGLVLSLIDVSERKRAELQLEHQNQDLRELTKAEHRQRELAEGLVQATIALNTSLKLDQVLCSVLEQIRKAIPFQGADIVLVEGKTLQVASCLGFEDYPQGIPSIQESYNLDDYPLLQQVCSTFQPAIFDSVTDHIDWRANAGMEWVRAYVAAPLIIDGAVTGIIELTSEFPEAFTQDAVEQLIAFTAPAALALHNAQVYNAESTARQVAETLSAAAQALTQTLDLEHVFDTLLDHIHGIIHSDTAGVTLLEDETRLVVRALRGFGEWADVELIPTFPITGMTDSVIRRLNSDRRSLFIPNTDINPISDHPTHNGHIRGWLVVPIIASEKIIGLVEFGKAGEEPFVPEQIQWAEALVGQAAVAIQNAWLFEQVRASSERLQSLARKLVEIQENERYNIARELHDEAGQALSSMKLSLGKLESDPDCPQHVRQRLLDLKGVADSVLEELHRLAMDLRPVALDRLGLVAALEQFAYNMHSEWLSVQFKAVGFEGERLSKDLETALYRIVQEALTNVVRHAHASNVGILLERSDGKVRVFIEDDGIGFETDLLERIERLGLVGMRERAEMFAGILTIESSAGKGTSVIVEVPVVHTDPYRG